MDSNMIDNTSAAVPLVSVHDSWISVDPIVGCPARCCYCFLQKNKLTGTAPTIRVSPADAVAALAKLIERHSDLARSRGNEGMAPVCIGNYTDMFMHRASREYLIDYLICHHARFPDVPVALITKARLNDKIIGRLDAIGHRIILFLSQSFLSLYQDENVCYEHGASSPRDTVSAFRIIRNTNNISPVHFWRPLTCVNVPDRDAAEQQVAMIRDAGALASVAVGLKYGEYLYKLFSDATHPLHDVIRQSGNSQASLPGETFPSHVRRFVIEAASKFEHPVYFNTSCAVALALQRPDALRTWDTPAASRCFDAECPSSQRARCMKQGRRARGPSEELLNRIGRFLNITRDVISWDAHQEFIRVRSVMSQSDHCAITRATRFRVCADEVALSREFCAPNELMPSLSISTDAPFVRRDGESAQLTISASRRTGHGMR